MAKPQHNQPTQEPNQSGPNYVTRDECEKLFVKKEDAVLHLAPDDRYLIAVRLVRMPAFWLTVGAVLVALVWFGYEKSKDFIQTELSTAKTEMTNRINREFETERIKQVIAEVAAFQASNLLRMAISSTIANLEASMNSKSSRLECRVVFRPGISCG